jgi:AcrR family transcriptional regulator
MSERRQELIGKALDYMVMHGVAGLTLRPLAGAIGTSARLLAYHFGSKDGLITAVMDEVRARAQGSFAEAVARPGKGAAKGAMRTFWAWTIHPENVGHMRLLFEVQVLAIRDPATYGPYLRGTSGSWLELIEASLPPSRRNRAVATLCTAVIDGLLLEYLSSGDGRRTTRALEHFGRLMTDTARDGGSSGRKPATGRIGTPGRTGRRERGRA